jgi:predicted metal-dependent enzyme (double-stranded beta helix superfamily)
MFQVTQEETPMTAERLAEIRAIVADLQSPLEWVRYQAEAKSPKALADLLADLDPPEQNRRTPPGDTPDARPPA